MSARERRVLLQNRVDALTRPGGDTRLMLDIARHLDGSGWRADISTELEPDLSDYDLIHLFNISRVHETYCQLAHAKRCGKPVVCSTIYHDYSEFNRRGRCGARKALARLFRNTERLEYAKNLVRSAVDPAQRPALRLQRSMGYAAQQKRVLAESDLLMLAASAELETIRRDFDCAISDYRVVPFGVDAHWSDASPDAFVREYGLRGFVLCVGRIEEVKNQLSLLRALRGAELSVVLVGAVNPSHRSYYRRILKEARGTSARLIPTLSEDLLKSAYAAASVHALPSWCETFGLVSLEAALAGANIVTTDRTYATEYLADRVWYCDPGDLDSIRRSVLAAHSSPRRDDLRQYITTNLTWDHAIGQVIAAYDTAVVG